MSNISRFIGNERGDKICHEDDGCPTELAVLKRFWREQQASTLPEEVANLVELLDEEEAPYEDSSGVALSLAGRAKQYANGKTATLREQVEKLENRLNKDSQEFTILCAKETEKVLREQLAALAEQNERQSKALNTLLDISQVSHVSANTLESVCRSALSLPDLATPVLNKYRAEGMRMAAEILIDPMDKAAAQKICAQADELEKANG